MAKRTDLQSNEFNAFYGVYIEQVTKEVELVEGLISGSDETVNFFESLPESKWEHIYAEGKWTPKEVFLHLIDAERVFGYRALRFSRKDTTALSGFEQDDFVIESNANKRSVASLIEEYKVVRAASIVLFKNMNEDSLSVLGTASNSGMTPRAAGFIICGHERHHISIIKERYL